MKNYNGKIMNKIIFFVTLAAVALLTVWQPQTLEAQERELYREGDYYWTVWREFNDGVIKDYAMIVNYTGKGGNVQIPSLIDGIPVVAILDEAFMNKGLTSVTIPNSVIGIGPIPGIGTRAFDSNQLTSISLPSGLIVIGIEAFAGNLLTNISIPNGVTHISAYAFAENRLTSVNIPNSVTSIEEGAFAGNLLTSVNIPNSVTRIGKAAFAVNRLTSVIVPSGTQIGENAFTRNGSNSDKEATITRR